MKKLPQLLCLVCCYMLQKVLQKWSKIAKKKADMKKIQGVKCLFFSVSNDIFPGVLPWLKLDLQTCNGQRLTSVEKYTNKFQLTKCRFF